MDKLLTKLSENQQAAAMEHGTGIKRSEEAVADCGNNNHLSSSSPIPITPVTDSFSNTAPTTRPASAAPNDEFATTEELLRLKLELAQAQNKISRLDHELAQSRIAQSESGRVTPVISPGSEYPVNGGLEPFGSRIAGGLGAAPGASKTMFSRESPGPWQAPDDLQAEATECLPTGAGGFQRSRGIWGGGKSALQNTFASGPVPMGDNGQTTPWQSGPGYMDPNATSSYGPPLMDGYRTDRLNPDHEMMRPPAARRGRYDNRFGSPHGFGAGYSSYNLGPGQYDSYAPGPASQMPSNMPMNMYPQYQQQAGGSGLSPHATEFTSNVGAAWRTDVSQPRTKSLWTRKLTVMGPKTIATEGPTYLPTTEPLNYRRLLDRNVNCNWKYIVDKIVCNNDQQASIFLQQKLKVRTPEQKYEIVEAIVAQAYPLMVNRFGNFLVQRCFEHGTPEQVIKIAEAIRGNTLNLSMDPFGCHVVQKAFDSVPEDYKAIMVHELLRRIPETVIHRYACHVWQKLFELRWTESPPQIMRYVNEALRGMWHEVALGETGSLVVQNIFENCLEEDKVCRPSRPPCRRGC